MVPSCMLRRFVRPDGTQQPARSKWRVKTRSGASGDLGGPGGGCGRRERVLLMRCTALVGWLIRAALPPAAAEGEHSSSRWVSGGKGPGSEDRATRRICDSPSVSSVAANDEHSWWPGYRVATQRHREESRKPGSLSGWPALPVSVHWMAGQQAQQQAANRAEPPARAVLAGGAKHRVAVVAQHGTGGVVGDDQRRLGEVGEKEQLTGSAQRKRLTGALPARIPLGDEPDSFDGRLHLDFDVAV